MLYLHLSCFSFQSCVAQKNMEPESQTPERSLCSARKVSAQGLVVKCNLAEPPHPS